MVVLPFLTGTVLRLGTFLGKNFTILVFKKGLPVIFYLRIFIPIWSSVVLDKISSLLLLEISKLSCHLH
jgi:hypothetical protein